MERKRNIKEGGKEGKEDLNKQLVFVYSLLNKNIK